MTQRTRKHNPNWHDPPEAKRKRKEEFNKRRKELLAQVDEVLSPLGLTQKTLLEGIANCTLSVIEVPQPIRRIKMKYRKGDLVITGREGEEVTGTIIEIVPGENVTKTKIVVDFGEEGKKKFGSSTVEYSAALAPFELTVVK